MRLITENRLRWFEPRLVLVENAIPCPAAEQSSVFSADSCIAFVRYDSANKSS